MRIPTRRSINKSRHNPIWTSSYALFFIFSFLSLQVQAETKELLFTNTEGEVSSIFIKDDCDNVTDGGEIQGNETGCDDPFFDPSVITNLVMPSGGTGDLEFIWVSTTDNPDDDFVVWSPIPGSMGASYDPDPITETTYFMRCARRTGCIDYIGESNIVEKMVQCCDNITNGGIIVDDQEACGPSYDPSPLTNLIAPSGGTGEVEYLWFQSTVGPPFLPDSPDWTAIPNSNSPEYDPAAISQTTYFIRCARREECTNYTGESNIIIITIHPSPTVSSVTTTNPSCWSLHDGSIAVMVENGTPPYTYEWSTGNDNSTIDNLGAGTYQLTVTDSNACSNEIEVSLSEPDNLTVDIEGNNIVCNSNNLGTATATANGGIMPYIYQWNDPNNQTTATATGLEAGNYIITVTDANNCMITSVITIENQGNLGINIMTNNLDCPDENNGTATAAGIGGTAPYEYLWSTSETTATISNLPAGTYGITVTDQNECSTSTTATIETPEELIVNTATTNVSCPGAANGIAEATVSGGTAPYTYQWNDTNNQTTALVSNLVAGNYSVTVTDSNNCTNTAAVTIAENNGLTIFFNRIDANCADGSLGIAVANIANGTEPYTYQWNDPEQQTTDRIENLEPGIYTVTIMDANGCTTSDSIDINLIGELTLGINKTDATCSDASDGSATVSVIEGTAPFQYEWSNGETQASINNVTPNTYTVTVTDANGCTGMESVTIEAPSEIILTTSTTDATCDGATGTATVQVTGGTSPYTYLWNDANAQTTATATNLSTGSYTVTITDANNCTSEATVFVNSESNLDVSIQVNHPICTGDVTGTATVTVNTGTAPFTYQWNDSNMQTTATASQLTPGTYTVQVIDTNGCATTEEVIINEGTMINLSTDGVPPTCADNQDGAAIVTASGGEMPYAYIWNDASMQTTATAVGLVGGSYTVTVIDANNCNMTADVTLETPEGLSLTVMGMDVNCATGTTGSAIVIAMGGTAPYFYAWNDAAQQNTATASNLEMGTYQVTVTDDNGCNEVASVTIDADGGFDISFTINDISCPDANDGMASVNVTGGLAPYTYLWENGATTTTISDLHGGNYDLTVTDANGCTSEATATINKPEALQLTLSGTNINCVDGTMGTATATVTGGTTPYTYIWNDANAQTTMTATDLAVGTYNVVVTDANGCTIMSSIAIQTAGDFEVEIIPTSLSCAGANDGQATANPTGGVASYTYLWNNGETTATIENLSIGTYTVTVTDANTCSVENSVTISQPAPLEVSVTATNGDCSNGNMGSATATPSGGTAPYTYFWDLPTPQTTATATGLNAGTYTVIVTDANSCVIAGNVTIEMSNDLNINITKTDVSCVNGNDGTAQSSVNGGTTPFTYAWSNNATTADLMNLSAGTYTLTVTDGNGCSGTSSVTIASPDAIQITVNILDASCNGLGGRATASANGGTAPYTYQWDDPNLQNTAIASDLSPGDYSVVVTDANGCTNSTTITIVLSGALNVDIIASSNSLCSGGSISLSTNPTGGQYFYSWSATGGNFDNSTAANPTYTMMTPGTYTISVEVSDENGCQGTASVEVTVSPQPSISISPNNTGVCSGTPVNFSVVPADSDYTYSWTATGGNFDNANSATPTYTMMMPGTYTINVTIDNAEGCSATASTTITIGENPTCSAGVVSPISVRNGADGSVGVNVFNGTSPYTYDWSNGDMTQTITGLGAGTYTVTVTDDLGCSCMSSITLNNPAKLGNFVWQDLDRDGIQDNNEPGIPNVSVTLSGTDVFNNPVNATLTTDASGMYMFDGLEAGTYKITFDTPQDYTPTLSNEGSNEALDSDADPNTGMTEMVTLNYGDYNQDLDAGFYSNTINIGDYLWHDFDRDGIQDSNEQGIGDVLVTLYDLGLDETFGTDDDTPLMGTYTDFTGHYLFSNVPPGKYVIEFHPFTIPNGYTFTTANQGGDDALDSDVDTLGVTHMFMIMEDQMDDLTFDAGIYQKCNNITNGGMIEGDETVCGPGADPSLITNISLPSGGFGEIEYLWMMSTSTAVFNGPDDPNWQAIPGATGPEYDPGPIFNTAYFARCARRECCSNYFEANIVRKFVSDIPQASIESGPSTVCTQETVSYTATFTGNTTTYTWNFGANAVPATYAGRIVPEVRWTSSGNKTVTLTTNLNGCENMSTNIVSVSNCIVPLGQFEGLTGELMEEAYVMLKWSTTAEPFQSRFVIERADIEQDKFYTLDLMEGHGGSESHTYQLKDTKPLLGHNYYRIKHMDNNGEYVFSETISIFWQPNHVKDIHVFPNPFRERTTLQVLNPLEEDGTIQLVSAYGQVLDVLPLAADTHQMTLDFSAYPKGLYVIYICYNGHRKLAYRLLKTDDF